MLLTKRTVNIVKIQTNSLQPDSELHSIEKIMLTKNNNHTFSARKSVATTLTAIGVPLLVYGVIAFAIQIQGFQQIGPEYWDTLSSLQRVLIKIIGALAIPLGSLFLVGGFLHRDGANAGTITLIITGGVLALFALVRLPLPTTSTPFFGMGGTLLLVFFVLTLWDWAKQRRQTNHDQRAALDLHLAGLMFYLLAAFLTCNVGIMSTISGYPDQAIYARNQGYVVQTLYRIMIAFFLGSLLTYIGQRKAVVKIQTNSLQPDSELHSKEKNNVNQE